MCVLCNHQASCSPVRCHRVATDCETAGRAASGLGVGRVVPTMSHRISTTNAGGMAALLRSETTDHGTTPWPNVPRAQAGPRWAAWPDETLTLTLNRSTIVDNILCRLTGPTHHGLWLSWNVGS